MIHCVMECGLHVTHWPSQHHAPSLGEFILCPKCGGYKHVCLRILGLRVRCRDCTYSAAMGEAKINSDVKAIHHVQRKPGHTVEVRRDIEVWKQSPLTEKQLDAVLKSEWRDVRVFRNDNPQLFDGDEPSF